MNKENAHLYLPLIQALADGKTIQENNYQTCPPARYEWTDLQSPNFTREPDRYRVKPELREWNMWVTPGGLLTTNSDMMMRESVRVREVTED